MRVKVECTHCGGLFEPSLPRRLIIPVICPFCSNTLYVRQEVTA